ncbi:MAG: GTPase HflX [Bdellovibrionota bacterium]|nr:GTPase HflX [Bdellovibrionota bacterium]
MSRKRNTDQNILDRAKIERSKLDTQKAILVGVGLNSEGRAEIKDSLAELMELADTAGAEVVGSTQQVLDRFVPATLIGSGKLQEIKEMVEQSGANLVIVDHQLSGQQSVNLESVLKVAVLDRTQLILDIFAQRAQSHEGKIQVELAQMLDQLPRMVGAWMGSLSRQGGGIGTRGPGETALEMDRRRIRSRVDFIKKQLKEVEKRRAHNRYSRKRNQVPSFALIGYTNAGKSTLLNALSKSDIYAKDQLFATLDPTTRKIFLPEGKTAVLTDTVGFIRRLPTKLIEAFKATLEESGDSDILLHVVDRNSPSLIRHVEVVEELIKELGWGDKPILHVLNKSDIENKNIQIPKHLFPRVNISAQTGLGLDRLKEKMTEMISSLQDEKDLFFSNSDRHHLYELARDCSIIKQEESQHGVVCRVKISPNLIHKWSDYLIKKEVID